MIHYKFRLEALRDERVLRTSYSHRTVRCYCVITKCRLQDFATIHQAKPVALEDWTSFLLRLSWDALLLSARDSKSLPESEIRFRLVHNIGVLPNLTLERHVCTLKSPWTYLSRVPLPSQLLAHIYQ